eukprot:gene4314-3128_t
MCEIIYIINKYEIDLRTKKQDKYFIIIYLFENIFHYIILIYLFIYCLFSILSLFLFGNTSNEKNCCWELINP